MASLESKLKQLVADVKVPSENRASEFFESLKKKSSKVDTWLLSLGFEKSQIPHIRLGAQRSGIADLSKDVGIQGFLNSKKNRPKKKIQILL